MYSQFPMKAYGPLQMLDAGGQANLTVMMLHGYGADAFDLASLAPEVRLRRPVRWLFPQAPLEVEIGPGFWGRAWFPIDIMAHQAAVQSGRELDYATRRPPGLDRARDLVLRSLQELKVSPKQLVLGGFSQGSMVAVEVALHLPEPPAGLVLLSGTLVDEKNWGPRMKSRPGVRYLQSHGERDEILPFSGAEKLAGLMTESGWDGHLLSFRGGHEIPASVVREMGSFMDSIQVNQGHS